MRWLAFAVICTMYPHHLPLSNARAQAANRAQTVNKDAATLADFKNRVAAYIALQKKVADRVGPLDPTRSPKEIATREKSLGEAMRAARPGAREGDVLSPDAGDLFRDIIRKEFAARSRLALKNRDDAQDELPDFTPMVNQIYPSTYPLATFPPGLLRRLPPLPRPLEYRFVQRNLIVRDREANLIVDVLPAAAPVFKREK